MADNQNKELVTVDTELVALTIKGAASHPVFSGQEIEERKSRVTVRCERGHAYSVVLHGGAGGSGQGTMTFGCMPLFYEQQGYELVVRLKAPEGDVDKERLSFGHVNMNLRNSITPLSQDKRLVTGRFNFNNDIGLSDFYIYVDGKEYLKLTLEVYPSKLSYEKDYEAIVADVTNELYGLVFDFLKKTYKSFEQKPEGNHKPSTVEYFAILDHIYKDFIKAADMVIFQPHHELVTEHEVVAGHKVKRTDNRCLRWLEKHSENVAKVGAGFMADKALTVRKHVTYDTKENRITKFMLENTIKRIEHFKRQYSALSRESDAAVLDKADTMVKGIARRCNAGFLRQVDAGMEKSGMSLVFGMAPGYRELYRCYMMLQRGLSLTGDIFNLSVKDLAVLYEYWCFIKLNSILKRHYKLCSDDLVRMDSTGFTVQLVKGRSSELKYENPGNGERITLSYNQKEVSGYTVPQKPDNILSLKKKGAETDYRYVFDAKYRINPALPDSYYFKNYGGVPGPQEDDINTMHRYRDAIVFGNKDKDELSIKRSMFGAYVLFPYNDGEKYKKNKFYESIEKMNIGGLPFLPGETQMVENFLNELIAESPDAAFERATLPVGIEKRLANVDWSKREVLVGVLARKEQLDVCLEHGFYYIPKSRVAVDPQSLRYVAMYQSKNIFKDDSVTGIRYYGEIAKVTEVARKDITEVPLTGVANAGAGNGAGGGLGAVSGEGNSKAGGKAHGKADAPYYRFEVRKWQELPKAVAAGSGIRVNIYTNLFLLQCGKDISELLLRSEAEYRLYVELKRRYEELQIKYNGKAKDYEKLFEGFELDGKRFTFMDGKIFMTKLDAALPGGQAQPEQIGLLSDFASNPRRAFRDMMDKVKKN